MFLDMTYPVGAIYMSVNATSPATLFGGSWEAIEGRFLIGTNSTYTPGSTGGEATHTLTQAETPAHTHTRGTMNITGWAQFDPKNGYIRIHSVGGAFNRSGSGSQNDGTSSSSNTEQPIRLNLNAADSWTGATSSVGGNGAHNNMPPYLAVYMWKRMA